MSFQPRDSPSVPGARRCAQPHHGRSSLDDGGDDSIHPVSAIDLPRLRDRTDFNDSALAS